MKKGKILIIIGVIILLIVIIFFILGFLRKRPQPGNGNQPQQPQAPQIEKNQ